MNPSHILKQIPEEVREKFRKEIPPSPTLNDLFEILPDEIEIKVKMGKDVWFQMYERTQKNESGIIDERQVLNDWIIGCIRHQQRGVKFFYENGANEGIPSVRFLDENGIELPRK